MIFEFFFFFFLWCNKTSTISSYCVLQVIDFCIFIGMMEWKESKGSKYIDQLLWRSDNCSIDDVAWCWETHFDIMVCALIIQQVSFCFSKNTLHCTVPVSYTYCTIDLGRLSTKISYCIFEWIPTSLAKLYNIRMRSKDIFKLIVNRYIGRKSSWYYSLYSWSSKQCWRIRQVNLVWYFLFSKSRKLDLLLLQ